MNGQMGRCLSFVKKSGWNVKKGPFTSPVETTHVKMPWAGQNDLLPLQCDWEKSREFIEKKQLKNIDFGTIQQHFLRQRPNNIF